MGHHTLRMAEAIYLETTEALGGPASHMLQTIQGILSNSGFSW